jgi:hypothetical protein
MQFLESGENPVGEIDIDAERIKNLALKFERQSFAYQQMVVFGAPARSRQVGIGISNGSQVLSQSPFSDPPALQNESCTANSRYLLSTDNVKRFCFVSRLVGSNLLQLCR